MYVFREYSFNGSSRIHMTPPRTQSSDRKGGMRRSRGSSLRILEMAFARGYVSSKNANWVQSDLTEKAHADPLDYHLPHHVLLA